MFNLKSNVFKKILAQEKGPTVGIEVSGSPTPVNATTDEGFFPWSRLFSGLSLGWQWRQASLHFPSQELWGQEAGARVAASQGVEGP